MQYNKEMKHGIGIFAPNIWSDAGAIENILLSNKNIIFYGRPARKNSPRRCFFFVMLLQEADYDYCFEIADTTVRTGSSPACEFSMVTFAALPHPLTTFFHIFFKVGMIDGTSRVALCCVWFTESHQTRVHFLVRVAINSKCELLSRHMAKRITWLSRCFSRGRCWVMYRYYSMKTCVRVHPCSIVCQPTCQKKPCYQPVVERQIEIARDDAFQGSSFDRRSCRSSTNFAICSVSASDFVGDSSSD